MERIPDEVLDRITTGVNLMPGNLRAQLGDEPTLLVFLRHFGCSFCKETVSDLRAAAEAVPGYPAVLFFSQGSPREARAFLRTYWPGVRVVCDPDLAFYEAFGIGRGGLLEMFGPRALGAMRRAKTKGHDVGERSGDIWRMPGLFLVRGARVLWSHDFRHAGDHPDFARVPEIARAASAA